MKATKSKQGINPVIATVILVAVAIVIAIAVAFWASGLVGVFTRFEKLEIVAAWQNDTDSMNLTVRNTGSTPTSIIQVVLNGQQVFNVNPPIALDVGQQIQCVLQTATDFQAGVTYEIALKSAGGKTYPTSVLATQGGGGAGVPAISSFSCA